MGEAWISNNNQREHRPQHSTMS